MNWMLQPAMFSVEVDFFPHTFRFQDLYTEISLKFHFVFYLTLGKLYL